MPPSLRTAVRAVVRFASSVMMVSGVLLLADAALTVLWQEPISAFTAHQEQNQLEEAYEEPPARVIRRDPLPGDAIGKLEIPALDRTYFVVEGTDSESLRKGPGHYPETPLPGERGTVAIAGHRTTYGAPFRDVDDLERGDRISLQMPYGTYEYSVEKLRIVPATQTSVTRRVGYDRLVLTACHPLYSAAERIVVFARLERRGKARVLPNGSDGRGSQRDGA